MRRVPMVKLAPVLVLTCMLPGCAHTPDATIGYRLATTEVRFKVVRTVACTNDDRPVIATAVTPGTRHVADVSAQYAFALASIRGMFSDTDTTFEFYDDRRIRNINATSTGNGAPLLKTALSIAGAVVAFDDGKASAACASVAAAGANKPLALVYEGVVETAQRGAQTIAPDAASAPHANNPAIKSLVHAICAVVEETSPGFAPVESAPPTAASITAREPGTAKIRIGVSIDGVQCGDVPLWHDTVPVAQIGRMYQLPIPHAALFGKQAFAASFAESGALLKVQYGASGGAGAAMNALDSLAAARSDSAAQQVAEVKAQADLIYQQQRLVACLATPVDCK